MAASIATRVHDPGYTPAIRDLDALLDLFSNEDDELARAAERAVLRIEPRHEGRVIHDIVTRVRGATRPARGRLTRLVGRLAAKASTTPKDVGLGWLLDALADADPKTRHAAARALGKQNPEEDERLRIEAALVQAWDRGGDEDRRALAMALGKIGSEAARGRLRALPIETGKRASHAALILDRRQARRTSAAISLERAMATPVVVRFHARAGLEAVVAAELGDKWRPRIAGAGLVDARLDAALEAAAAVRTALHFGFPCDPVVVREELAQAIVDALVMPRTLTILRTFTVGEGPIRFRLAWLRGGHRRALAWRVAELVATRTSELVNDPTESTWEVLVDESADRVAIELIPRAFVDARFAYRTATVAASSHPTIAAALVRMVEPSPEDVVWDPFAGAGAELVERARLGPYKALIGTDLDEDAIRGAAANLNAANVMATLERADATTFEPGPVTLIVTNPPMGRRVLRGTHTAMLERFVDHAARVLAPQGALVWALPEPRHLNARAVRAGLALERAFTVDMGGFAAEFSVHRKV